MPMNDDPVEANQLSLSLSLCVFVLRLDLIRRRCITRVTCRFSIPRLQSRLTRTTKEKERKALDTD